MDDPLDKFGAFFVQNLRDKMLDSLEKLLRGDSKAPADQKLQGQLSHFSAEQKQVLRDTVDDLIKTGMHDLLFRSRSRLTARAPSKYWWMARKSRRFQTDYTERFLATKDGLFVSANIRAHQK